MKYNESPWCACRLNSQRRSFSYCGGANHDTENEEDEGDGRDQRPGNLYTASRHIHKLSKKCFGVDAILYPSCHHRRQHKNGQDQ
jgi:hypothetical protein